LSDDINLRKKKDSVCREMLETYKLRATDSTTIKIIPK